MHKIPWRFLCKSLHLGDYRGHISLAYPGTIPGAVNTLGGGSGLPGGRSADRRGRRSRRQILHRRQAVRVGGSDGGSVSGRRSAGWRTAPAVGRTAGHPPAPPTGRAQEIPNAQARAGIPCRAGAQAQRQREPSTAREASPPPAPPASRPQEIPNARAREDTTTRRPARNSKRARARYWRRGGRPLRVRKPKIFLGKGSKNRFRGAGAGKVGGVKNATEEENGAVLGKKEAAYAAADDEKGGRLYIWNGRALAYARGDAGCAEVGGGEASDGGYHFRGITKMVRGRAGRRCRTGK